MRRYAIRDKLAGTRSWMTIWLTIVQAVSHNGPNNTREAEDNDIMSSVPISSYDSPRAQVAANIA